MRSCELSRSCRSVMNATLFLVSAMLTPPDSKAPERLARILPTALLRGASVAHVRDDIGPWEYRQTCRSVAAIDCVPGRQAVRTRPGIFRGLAVSPLSSPSRVGALSDVSAPPNFPGCVTCVAGGFFANFLSMLCANRASKKSASRVRPRGFNEEQNIEVGVPFIFTDDGELSCVTKACKPEAVAVVV